MRQKGREPSKKPQITKRKRNSFALRDEAQADGRSFSLCNRGASPIFSLPLSPFQSFRSDQNKKAKNESDGERDRPNQKNKTWVLGKTKEKKFFPRLISSGSGGGPVYRLLRERYTKLSNDIQIVAHTMREATIIICFCVYVSLCTRAGETVDSTAPAFCSVLGLGLVGVWYRVRRDKRKYASNSYLKNIMEGDE